MGFYCPRCGSEASTAGTCPQDGATRIAVGSHDLIGRRLGEYTILAALGGGAYGSVYRAVHVRSGLAVAIKLLHLPVEQAESARVLVEAKAAAQLRHPNVVQVYDLALASDRRPYIVMQLLDGEPLAARIARGPLPVGEAVGYVRDVLDALASAHARGIVHRDLKPDNIVIVGARALVVDFGLAKLVADPRAPNLTVTGEALGTPAYMSPEQIRGRAVDARSDLYAVGCVLFECLTGRPPFTESATFLLFDAHVSTPPPALATLRADVPPAIAAAVARALAKTPTDRFVDAAAMREALASRPPAAARRLPLVAGVLAIVAVVLASVAVATVVSTDEPAPAAPATARPARRIVPREPYEPPLRPELVRTLAELATWVPKYDSATFTRLLCKTEASRRQTPPTKETREVRTYTRQLLQLLYDARPHVDPAVVCANE